MQAEGSATAQITNLRKQLAEAQYRASMDEEKIKAILKRHRINTLKLVSDSLDKGWQTWSKQAVELQLLRADRDNRKTQECGFFKMTKEAISAVQEEIAQDLYEMVPAHREEISQVMQRI